jgi:hypothetical protein
LSPLFSTAWASSHPKPRELPVINQTFVMTDLPSWPLWMQLTGCMSRR